MTKHTSSQPHDPTPRPRDLTWRRYLDAVAVMLTLLAGVLDLVDQQHLATAARLAATVLTTIADYLGRSGEPLPPAREAL